MIENIDVVVIGAGPAGLVVSRQAAEAGKRVLLVEKRTHIGGHCYDYLNEYGIYIHQYGPHIFHTDNKEIWEYLSRFTDWYYYHHRVKGLIDGKLVPIPFNLNSMQVLFSEGLYSKLEAELIREYGYGENVPILELRKKEDMDIQFLAEYIYEKVFLYYNLKQWGVRPEDLDPAVSGRVPVVISRDDRYFHDFYQGLPLTGYTAMFEKMIDHPNIHILLNTEGKDVFYIQDNHIIIRGENFTGPVVYTGAIDELFDCAFGELPYRSLRREFETHEVPFFQESAVVNYPNNYDYIRIAEFKHLQRDTYNRYWTTICREYPVPYIKGENNPYYVISNHENTALYNKYVDKADKIDNLYLVGRLAHYKYYNMDQVIEEALAVSSRIFPR